MVKRFKTPDDKYGGPKEGFNVVCTTYRMTEHYHYWTKNNPMNVQLVPEPFIEVSAEMADEMGLHGGERLKVSSIAGNTSPKAMVTRRIKPMMIDGKKTYQIGIPDSLGLPRHRRRRRQNRSHPDQCIVADSDRSQRVHAGIQRLHGEGGKGLGD